MKHGKQREALQALRAIMVFQYAGLEGLAEELRAVGLVKEADLVDMQRKSCGAIADAVAVKALSK